MCKKINLIKRQEKEEKSERSVSKSEGRVAPRLLILLKGIGKRKWTLDPDAVISITDISRYSKIHNCTRQGSLEK